MNPEEIREHIESHIDKAVSDMRPKWYHLNLSQTITILTVVAGGILSIGWYQARLNTVELQSVALNSRIMALDITGTTHSQSIALDHQLVVSHEQRVQKLEDVSSQLAVIQEQIRQIREDLKKFSDRVK